MRWMRKDPGAQGALPLGTRAGRGLTVATVVGAEQMRLEIRRMLEEAGFQVLGEAATVQEMTQAFTGWRPQVVLIHSDLPERGAPGLVTSLLGIDPAAKILVVLGISDLMGGGKLTKDCMSAGARGFVPEPLSTADLAKAIGKLG